MNNAETMAAQLNQSGAWGSGYTQAPRIMAGWEAAADRISEQGKRIEGSIARLDGVLAAVLSQPSPPPANGMDGGKPAYACDLLQVLNSKADDLSWIAERLEALIERIRL